MSSIDAAPRTGAQDPVESATWGSEFRSTFQLAWPLIIAQLAQNLLFTTDVVLMGWLGPQFLAAGTLAGAFLMPLMLVGISVVGAVAPLVAQARGSRRFRDVRRYVRQGLWMSLILGALLQPVLLSIEPIYLALGQDPSTTLLARDYIWAGSWLIFPAMATMAIRSLLAAYGDTRPILVVTVLGVFVNALAAYCLMFGHFGFPRLELVGAAIATGLVNLFMFIALLAYALRSRRFRRLHLLVRFWKPDWEKFWAILRIGTPIGLTVASEVGLFSVAALFMGRLGTNEVAAHAVALQLAATAFMVPLGLGMAATVRVGYAYGRGDSAAVGRAGWSALAMGMGFMSMTCIAFLVFPHALVSIFLDSTDTTNTVALGLAAGFLAIAGIFQLVDGAQVVAAHALRGLSDTKVPMLLALLGYWGVGLPIAYTLGFVLDWRGTGVWLGLASGLAFVAVVLVTRFALRERLGLLRALPG